MIQVFPIRVATNYYSYLVSVRLAKMFIDPPDDSLVFRYLTKTGHFVSHLLVTDEQRSCLGKRSSLHRGFDFFQGLSPKMICNDNSDKVNKDSTLNFDEIKITCIPSICHHEQEGYMYYIEDQNNTSKQNKLSSIQEERIECHRCVFTGDVYSIGGPGKFSKPANAAQLLKNITALAKLPKDTFIFPGYDNIITDLEFAMSVEPENEAYKNKLEWAQEHFIMPSTVQEQFDINIFWRTSVPSIQKKFGTNDPKIIISKLLEMRTK